MKPKRTGSEPEASELAGEKLASTALTPSPAPAESVPQELSLPAATLPADIIAAAEAVVPPLEATPPGPSWTTLSNVQTALTRGMAEAAVEITDMTRSGAEAVSDAAIAMLGARSVAEAVEINARLARRGLDAIVAGTARLTEIGVAAALGGYGDGSYRGRL